MLGIAHNHPLVQTGEPMNRQTISWNLGSALGGSISLTPVGDSNTAEPFGVRENSIEPRTSTQLAQKAEEGSESSESPRSPGS